MEKVVGFNKPNDVAILNKLLAKLDKNKVDSRYLAQVSTKTGNYIATLDDVIIRCDGTLTVTMPKASGSGKICWIKNAGTGNVTIAPSDGDTIDGLGSVVIATMVARQLVDGVKGNWDVI